MRPWILGANGNPNGDFRLDATGWRATGHQATPAQFVPDRSRDGAFAGAKFSAIPVGRLAPGIAAATAGCARLGTGTLQVVSKR